jgi:hypothetical protein
MRTKPAVSTRTVAPTVMRPRRCRRALWMQFPPSNLPAATERRGWLPLSTLIPTHILSLYAARGAVLCVWPPCMQVERATCRPRRCVSSGLRPGQEEASYRTRSGRAQSPHRAVEGVPWQAVVRRLNSRRVVERGPVRNSLRNPSLHVRTPSPSPPSPQRWPTSVIRRGRFAVAVLRGSALSRRVRSAPMKLSPPCT